MLPQVGGLEWLVIGMLALVVIKPQDLPGFFKMIGQWTAKLRGMANEFRASFDEMARQSELDELRKEVEQMRLSQSMNDIQASLEASSVPYQAPEYLEPVLEPDQPPPVKPARKRGAKSAEPGTPKKVAAKATAKPPSAPRKPKADV